MRNHMLVPLVLLVLGMSSIHLRAQKNEFSVLYGGGGLVAGEETLGTQAFTLAYARELPWNLGLEGSLDIFYRRDDDFGDAVISVLYHFAPLETGRMTPYVVAGIGKVSTDFTEIPGQVMGRVGGGLKYNFFGRWGLRVEIRDEIVRGNSFLVDPRYALANPHSWVHFPSVRAGIVYRF